jgi:putative glycerol-1-phosphate prenyltransferase
MRNAAQAPLLNYFLRLKQQGRKSLIWLVDPDKTEAAALDDAFLENVRQAVDVVFVGGSLLEEYRFGSLIGRLKEGLNCPVVLFPGSSLHLHPSADAILFLSLISGRNADLLIGRQVEAAPLVRRSGIEALPTGYMLVDGGRPTAAHYMSQTQPIPGDKPQIAACTAMAGELLGLRLMYLDAGSGAESPIAPAMVQAVARAVSSPLVVGGGIRDTSTLESLFAAGADALVLGTAVEEHPGFLNEAGRVRDAQAARQT